MHKAKKNIEDLKVVKEQALFDRACVQEELKMVRQEHHDEMGKILEEQNKLHATLSLMQDLKVKFAKIETLNEVQECKIEALEVTLREREARRV